MTRRLSLPRRLADLPETGLTLVELVISIALTSFFVALIMYFTFHYWRYGYSLNADLDLLTQRLNAGDFIREYVGNSSGLIIENSIYDANAGVVDATDGPGYWSTIHAVPGNKPMGGAGSYTPLFYFKRPSLNSSNAFIMNNGNPYEDEFVLYMDGTSKSLRLRTLANPSASGNRQTTSCPAASGGCPADRTLITDVSSVDLRYFSRTGNSIDYTSIVDPLTGDYIGPDFTSVEVVELTLNVSKKPPFQTANTTQSSTIIRIALRNK